ncbi:zinc finger protein 8-like isoform X2 [Haliotis rufescens]|uniref:zinc finger protein 8-like isoform X2 n=1 Tax=Haliotis rufescens TaxID=6454 RepID=UPI001EB0ACC0|nr:zinc finger protein 8-like isoform X2 [Haliotis rufescens]
MFIETLEFTIPIDLCDLFSTLKKGPRSNLEFPASVNSYGTTQDANIQVALRSNKLTFKVDGVSSNSSMISKSECKTLKLSVFDVDCSLSGAEYEQVTHMVSQPIYSAPHVVPAKRSRDRPSPMKSPPSKSSRSSFQETIKHENIPRQSPDPLQSRSMSETVSVKVEPDLIEIEPDSEHYGDESNQSIDRRHNTQAALDRLSHPQSSHSQSSASSSSSFHQNVPHVPDYAEPSTSQDHHGDQNVDDYVVYQQEDDDYGEENDNSADFGNDAPYVCGNCGKAYRLKTSYYQHVKRYHVDPALFCNHCGKKFYSRYDLNRHQVIHTGVKAFTCDFCGAKFFTVGTLKIHVKRVHGTPFEYYCKFCGKGYHDKEGLWLHERGHYDADMNFEEGSSDVQDVS